MAKHRITKKQREATRLKVAAWREKKKSEMITDTVTNIDIIPEIRVTRDTKITISDIENLPPSLKFQIEAGTRARQILKIPDNLRERSEAMVRRFRGY